MHSKTYCPYPFSHIAIDTDGAKTLCCVSARHDKTIPPMDSRVNQPINDYWNSKKLNKIRKELLLGQRPNECKTCWDFEDKTKIFNNFKIYIDYFKKTEVIIDQNKRKKFIEKELLKISNRKNLSIEINDKLLDEVTNLVNKPNIISCKFDEKFLRIPKEILITTMQFHQKYFF